MFRYSLLTLMLLTSGCAPTFEAAVSPGPPPVSRETLARQWFEIANLYANLGELERAEAAYRQSLELGMDERARHNLGLVQVRMGMASLASAQETLPVDPQTRDNTRAYLQVLLDQVGSQESLPIAAPPHP